jgi:hypothetical protein
MGMYLRFFLKEEKAFERVQGRQEGRLNGVRRG